MKYIFLDVDGVLNSYQFFCAHEPEWDMTEAFIDPEAVARLGRLVEETGAAVVLSSSWRDGWDQDPDKVHPSVTFLNDILASVGVKILDKTPGFGTGRRGEEILYWLSFRKKDLESFVIIDDADYHWEECGLTTRWVETDEMEGGLTEDHAKKAAKILAGKLSLLERIRLIREMKRVQRKYSE